MWRKWEPKTVKIEPRPPQNRAQMAPRGGLGGPKRDVFGIQNRIENGCIIGSLLGSTFWWILVRFWEAKWNQVGIKMEGNIDRTSKSDLMKKHRFSLGKTMIWKVAHVEVGSKIDQKSIPNRSKFDLNLGKHLDVDFSSIFFDFGRQKWSQVGREIEKNSIKKGLEGKSIGSRSWLKEKV